jgi:hypothetical protein
MGNAGMRTGQDNEPGTLTIDFKTRLKTVLFSVFGLKRARWKQQKQKVASRSSEFT